MGVTVFLRSFVLFECTLSCSGGFPCIRPRRRCSFGCVSNLLSQGDPRLLLSSSVSSESGMYEVGPSSALSVSSIASPITSIVGRRPWGIETRLYYPFSTRNSAISIPVLFTTVANVELRTTYPVVRHLRYNVLSRPDVNSLPVTIK